MASQFIAEVVPAPGQVYAPGAQDAIGFILRLGRSLHTYGYAAHRLEQVLDQATNQLGLTGQFFSTPTSIFASFGPQDNQRTFLIRVEPGEVDLGRLAMLDGVTIKVLHGNISPAVGSQEIEAILNSPERYGRVLTTLAFGLASASASRFLGGGLREVEISSLLGLVIGLLALVAGKRPALGRVFEPVAAFAASLLAASAGHWIGPYSVYNATLAGLIVLIPGFTLTVAMTELSTRHLVSGTARLTGAFVLFLTIAFGVALGSRISSEFFGPSVIAEAIALPSWTGMIALVTAPLAFTVLLRAHPRDAIWIVLT
ncbi:MAG: threonine/serine exporter family protein, partial [Gemmatimonadota bacterium]